LLAAKSDRSSHSTSADIAAAYQTIAASNAGLALKRDGADSLSTTQIHALAAASRPISSVTDLQTELYERANLTAVTIALSNKVDKEGSISESESNANLLARVGTPVPSWAVFTDTVWSPFDVTPGSLEIDMVAQLGAVLGSMQRTLEPGDVEIPMVNNLRASLDALSDAIAAIPTSRIHVAGGVQEQASFSIPNTAVDLNLSLGIWEWRVTPTVSQIQ